MWVVPMKDSSVFSAKAKQFIVLFLFYVICFFIALKITNYDLI